MVAHCSAFVTPAGAWPKDAQWPLAWANPSAAMPKLSAEQALKKAADLRAKAAVIANKGLMDQVVQIMKQNPLMTQDLLNYATAKLNEKGSEGPAASPAKLPAPGEFGV
jgi:hypothetical protein